MNKKCSECENEMMLKYADLEFKYTKATNYIVLLEKCLDVKDELCKALREDNEELRNKVRVYEQNS